MQFAKFSQSNRRLRKFIKGYILQNLNAEEAQSLSDIPQT